MARKLTLVTETELAVLEDLWTHSSCTIREIVDRMYGRHTPALHATVKSLLDRLSSKGFIRSDTSDFTHRFEAKISREEYVAREVERLVDSHFGGALVPLLMSLVEKIQLTRKERDAIRKIINAIPPKP